jgi:hypothetical protein
MTNLNETFERKETAIQEKQKPRDSRGIAFKGRLAQLLYESIYYLRPPASFSIIFSSKRHDGRSRSKNQIVGEREVTCTVTFRLSLQLRSINLPEIRPNLTVGMNTS